MKGEMGSAMECATDINFFDGWARDGARRTP
jgi:hypothetical protein